LVVLSPYYFGESLFYWSAIKPILDKSVFNHEIEVPNAPLREEVEIHLIPDLPSQAVEFRIWWNNHIVHSISYPLRNFPRVHF